jgi:hypothetical protein
VNRISDRVFDHYRGQDRYRAACRAWIALSPFDAVARTWSWWRWKHIPPWRLRASQLVIINPAPLDPVALAELRSLVAEAEGETPNVD